jgi:general stress protein 26
MTESQQKLTELLHDFDTAMLVTRSRDGLFRSRPMYIARSDDDGDLWFLASLQSGKLDELRDDPRANVSMQGKGKFLSLSGHVEIVTETETIENLWNPALKPWFPDGPATPDITAIHVVGKEAEYWDQTGAEGLKLAFEAARAVIEGRRPADDPPTRHGHLNL